MIGLKLKVKYHTWEIIALFVISCFKTISGQLSVVGVGRKGKERKRKGREGKGGKGKGREGKGKEREGKGREGKGREGKIQDDTKMSEFHLS